MLNEYIIIKLKNGDICHYHPREYTDYRYDGKCFIVIKNKQWIGIYNLDCLEYVEINTKENAEGRCER